MNRTDLIAPAGYNIVMDIEKHQHKENPALRLIDEQGNRREITYQQLLENVNKVGNVFLQSGLKKGDRVLIMVPKIIEAYEAYLACLKIGVIIIPSSEMLTTEDLQYRVSHGEVNGIISYFSYVQTFTGIREYHNLHKFSIGRKVEGWNALDDLKELALGELSYTEPKRSDIAFLPYTSGTTGHPKGVVHTHEWGYAHLRTVAKNWLDIREGNLVWATAAPGWQKWVWSPLLSVLGSGATGFIYSGKFNPNKYLHLLQDEKINVLCCTPTEYRMMAKSELIKKCKLADLHSAVSAGEPLNREVIDVFQKYFALTVRDGYGQTENTLLLGIMKNMEIKPGSMGKPTPGNTVAIINENAEPVEIGEVGDIAVSLDSPALFKEYYKDVERTKQSIRGDYYITGDRASIDEDGYFWFEGRDDDIIISSGYTIGPFEVEDVLTKHAAVQECAVVGSPDNIRGQVVKAFIVLKENINQDESLLATELKQFCKQHTAPYKYPREIEFVKELPKTTSGKIRRVELRELEKKRKA